MHYSLTKPCPQCPFLKGQRYLSKSRAKEIASAMTGNGSTFACHKTTHHDDEGQHLRRDNEQHCAGARLFMEKVNPGGTQMIRIAERFGMYDRRKLTGAELVYDSSRQMVAAHGGR